MHLPFSSSLGVLSTTEQFRIAPIEFDKVIFCKLLIFGSFLHANENIFIDRFVIELKCSQLLVCCYGTETAKVTVRTTLTVQGIEYIDSEFRECLMKSTGHESDSIHEKRSHLEIFFLS